MKEVLTNSPDTSLTHSALIKKRISRAIAHVNPWILCQKEASTNIVCFHAAGCQATTFMPWHQYFSTSISVVPIVLPKHGSRLSEHMPSSLQEIASDFLNGCSELFNRPTILFGHSMGAMIAYEVASFLQMQGRQAAALIVSGAQSPNRREVVDRTIGLTESEFLEVLRAYGSISEDLLHDRMFLDYYLPIAQADFSLCELYDWQVQPVLSLPIHTFNGKDDAHINRDGVEQWEDFTSVSCTHHVFEGGHFYCDENPAEVCALIESISR